ncbi:hypothetical protein [Pseudomonas amygdali]|uniref:Uncharacterized protein n=2 Tax=Pseudomonas amygdali TaxID=47877 RepID=A0AAD0PX06_PSEAV|nr:hypothetical protein [Pseudomonas amygdali]AXH60287.1 hypothetical protein PLA107_034455 [Pseudomonas amygdali pv. lachrymans str. M301315]
MVIAIHEHIVRQNYFDAHYLIDSMVTLGGSITPEDQVPPTFWSRVNDILVDLFSGRCPVESGLTFVRGLSKLKVLEQMAFNLRTGFEAMSGHYLESQYGEEEADAFVRMVNTLIADDPKILARPRTLHLLAMAKYLEDSAGCYRLDLEVLKDRIKTNNRFIEDIGSIVNPLINALMDTPDDVRTRAMIEKLADPLYDLIKQLSSAPGISKVNDFLTNLSWLGNDRIMVGEFSSDHPISLCNPKRLGELVTCLVADQFMALHKSLNSPVSSISVSYEKAGKLVELMRASTEAGERQRAMTTLFCALLASHHYMVTSPYGEGPLVASTLLDLYPEVDIQQAEATMKKRHGMKLTLYIRDQHRNDLGKLGSRSRDDLFGHDLGL